MSGSFITIFITDLALKSKAADKKLLIHDIIMPFKNKNTI